ncbi:hypothetical protein Kfla_4603 [Kribbella flavida DSM 17836]|uniref:Uncharacterized protein n=2 Tax=Kribbella flavida TaxID=182640 RepID=D2PY15_KRIFD|nr:hypothetical protein Kfla_4603 [Kribbella flavida DSM 17836]
MALEALIPLGPGQPELEIALSGTGQAVTLDAADAESASEFAVWFVETMLPGESGAHLMELGAMRAVEVAAGLDADEVRRRLG